MDFHFHILFCLVVLCNSFNLSISSNILWKRLVYLGTFINGCEIIKKAISYLVLHNPASSGLLSIFYSISSSFLANFRSYIHYGRFLYNRIPSSSSFQAYLAVVWNLALLVSVLEKICGIEALGKAEQLIKGSKRHGFSLNILFGALSLSVFCGVLMSENAAMIPLLLLNSMYCLIEMFKLTTYTVLYHECKETHGEELEMQEGTKYTKVAFTPLISADATYEGCLYF
ncbi:hypothetical protein GBA52_004775 [Prunus armeniaca]|nr:hypothetical protein GBA52_004775 [Prunus armeniaca]